ncbi:MAG: T9SS type A sorting domain-containing protein [Bacteroidota bacterium]
MKLRLLFLMFNSFIKNLKIRNVKFSFTLLLFFTFTQVFANTLCDDYGGNTGTVLGTTITSSSQLSSNSISGNILVQGDFTIDNNFTFLNAIVEVDQDIKITVAGGQILTLDNSKFFHCGTESWKGFDLGTFGIINGLNGTEIEDAFMAIDMATPSTVNLEDMVFNRNHIGINVPLTASTSFPTNVNLNGSVEFTESSTPNIFRDDTGRREIFHIGIRVDYNSPLTLGKSLPQLEAAAIFRDLDYGIYTVEQNPFNGSTTLLVDNLEFNNTVYGIYMERGNITITDSDFIDLEVQGIYVGKVVDIDVSDNCVFRFNQGFLVGPLFPAIDGINANIYLDNFEAGSDVRIIDCIFDLTYSSASSELAELSTSGVFLDGGFVGGNTEIFITNNTFKNIAGGLANNQGGFGVQINGMFTNAKKVLIEQNDFVIDGENGTDISTGVRVVNGDKSNIIVASNTFSDDNSYTTGDGVAGIHFEGSGSNGINNDISTNVFPPDYSHISNVNLANARFGVRVIDFQNLKICGNEFHDLVNGTVDFTGTCSGTNLVANQMYVSGAGVNVDGVIGVQEHKGNLWFKKFDNGNPSGGHATLSSSSSPALNRFTVHTPVTPPTSVSGSYHPDLISPSSGWFEQQSGTPETGCAIQASGGSSNERSSSLEYLIANDIIEQYESNPTAIWNMKRYLMAAIERSSALKSEYSSFLQRNQDSNIGTFQRIRKALNKVEMTSMSGKMQELDDLKEQYQRFIEELKNLEQNYSPNDEAYLSEKRRISESLSQINYERTSIQNEYKEQLSSALQIFQRENRDILAEEIYERNEKAFNAIYLSTLIDQRAVNETEITILKSIARQCPKYGGLAVYYSRGLLPFSALEKYDDKNEDCYFKNIDNNIVEERELETFSETFTKTSVYPNPARDIVTVDLENPGATINILDLSGRQLQTWETNTSQAIINIKSFQKGFYYLHIEYQNGVTFTKKLLIQ